MLRRCPLRCLLLLFAAVLLGSGPAFAGSPPLELAVSSSGVNCAGLPDSDSGPLNTQAACEREIDAGTDGSHASTAGGMAILIPIFVSGQASSITILHPVTMFGLAGSSTAGASIDFEFRIDQIAQPPFFVNQIPIRITGSFQASAVFPSNANATVTSFGFNVLQHSNPPPVGMPPNPDVLQSSTLRFAAAGQTLTFGLTANCNAISTADPSQQVQECFASSTASFRLDQDDFDLSFGGESFPLDDFYLVEISPNAVPEPGATSSTVAVLAMLTGLARWRRAARVFR